MNLHEIYIASQLAKNQILQKNDKYELIEEITVTEENISIIERTQTPDGTPYNFKKMIIIAETTLQMHPKANEFMYNDQSVAVFSHGINALSAADIQNRQNIVMVDFTKGILFGLYSNSFSSNSCALSVSANYLRRIEEQNIARVRYGCNDGWRVGDKIIIMAVRG